MTTPFKLKYKNSAFPFKSPLKDSGHGGHPGMTKKEIAAADHGGKMTLKDKLARKQIYLEKKIFGRKVNIIPDKNTKETKDTKKEETKKEETKKEEK